MDDDSSRIILLMLWGVIGVVIGAAIGSGKNRTAEGAILGFLLGPIGWVITFYLPKNFRYMCPACRGGIEQEATRCRHCGLDFAQSKSRPVLKDGVQPKLGSGLSRCGYCGAIVSSNDESCRNCGGSFEEAPAPAVVIRIPPQPTFKRCECPGCGVTIEFPEEGAGQTSACPKCGEEVLLKDRSPVA